MEAVLLLLWVPISFGTFPFLYILLRYGRFKLALGTILALCALGMPLLWTEGSYYFIWASIYWSTYPIVGLILYKGFLARWSVTSLYFWLHVPVAICGLFLFYFLHLNAQGAQLLSQLSTEWLGSMAGLEPEIQKSIEQNQKAAFFLFPGLVVADLSIRLVAGIGILRYTDRRKKIGLGIPEIRGISYADWPIWFVVTGLLSLVLGAYVNDAPLLVSWGAGCILVGVLPYYFLRGLSVCLYLFFRRKGDEPLSLPSKIFFFLLILFVPIWVYTFISVVSLGILDTWFDWRSRAVPLKNQ